MAYELPNRTNEILNRVDRTPLWFQVIHNLYIGVMCFVVGISLYVYLSLLYGGFFETSDMVLVHFMEMILAWIISLYGAVATSMRNPSMLRKWFVVMSSCGILYFVWYMAHHPEIIVRFVATMEI